MRAVVLALALLVGSSTASAKDAVLDAPAAAAKPSTKKPARTTKRKPAARKTVAKSKPTKKTSAKSKSKPKRSEQTRLRPMP